MTDQKYLMHKQSRAFNEVLIDKHKCIVTKTSSNMKKLEAEAYWYKNMPIALGGYVPKLLDFSRKEDSAVLTMDYYPYATLSELFTKDTTHVNWSLVVVRLLDVLDAFHSCTTEACLDSIKTFYLKKNWNRIEQLRKSSYWNSLMKKKFFRINNRSFPNIDLDFLMSSLESHFDCIKCSVVHGDYCLSNILYDFNSNCVKLIDPRGANENGFTIYGDSNYDVAKLLHSIHGFYDFIVQGKYTLLQLDDGYGFRLHVPDSLRSSALLDVVRSRTLVSDSSRHFKFQLLLEVLLFVTMIPLHYEDSKRQLAFYLRAVQLFSEYTDYIKT